MGTHRRLRARIAILVAIGAIAVAAGVALLLGNTITLRANTNATLRSNADLVALIRLERLVVDAETGLRGYVITGRPLFLAPLRAARATLPRAIAGVDRAAIDDRAFVSSARKLETAVRSYFAGYVPDVLAMVSRSPNGARSFAETIAGKRLVDDVRARTSALEQRVTDREAERQRDAHAAASASIAEAIGALVLLTVLTVAIGAVLGRLAVGREIARERSERTSRILQQSLLPNSMPAIPGCELAVRFQPAAAGELVGGDFCDVFELALGQWAIVVGDVCGKGAEAAAVTAMARWTLRSLGGEPHAPEQALRRLNATMLRQNLGGRYITIAYLRLTVEPDTVRVSVACAGHPPPIVVPAGGKPSAVSARGTLLGVWPEIFLHTCEVNLTVGDGLVVYTDGVTDQGPESRLAAPEQMLARGARGASAEELATALEDYARSPGTIQRDDIAIVALRVTGAQPEASRTDTSAALAPGSSSR